jgi:DNA-binding response OmpR family regulator
MRILIVEDDRRLAASMQRGLEESGFAADSVYDGEEAFAAALSTGYDVILLDVMLPKLDGIHVSRQLRDHRVDTPILMLTARDSLDDKVVGLEGGADDYLVKPFALREVVARIKALTRRHVADRRSTLVAGPLSLDTSARTLEVASRQVRLTAKEYAILEYFMLNQHHLITREQVIEHVWNFEFDGSRNLIEVYIGRLRRKIADSGATDPFTTVRGSGYRFEYQP